MNSKKTLPSDRLSIVLTNMANYIECILMENLSLNWGPFLAQAEIFFRRVVLIMSSFDSFSPFFKNIISILRIPGVVLFKVKIFSIARKLIPLVLRSENVFEYVLYKNFFSVERKLQYMYVQKYFSLFRNLAEWNNETNCWRNFLYLNVEISLRI